MAISKSGNTNQVAIIEASTTPDDPGSWTTISTVMPTGSSSTFTDVNAGQFKTRFYRVTQ